MNTKQQGFTLIELVVVIVILGILAAVAVPRFVSMQGDARYAVLQGVNAAMQSTASMVHAKSLATGTTNGNLPAGSIEGLGTVAVVNGYPATTRMTALLNLQPTTNFTISAATGTIQIKGASDLTKCQVVYTQPTAAGNAPTITMLGSGANCL